MVGIAKYSAYIPRLRLSLAQIAEAWGRASVQKGEVAVGNYDEDAFTLALEAAFQCTDALGQPPDGLFFASTSAPYREKQLAAYAATVCDLPRTVCCMDFGGSARAGLHALLAAENAVRSGRISSCLVLAAEARLAEPESEWEGLLGDAGAAVVVAREQVAAEIVDSASINEEFTYFWRTDTSPFVRAQPGKFSQTYGYVRDVAEAIRAVLERRGLRPANIAKLALHTPEARAAAEVARRLGFDPRMQLVEPPGQSIGSAGAADPLLALGAALDEARPEEWVIVAGFGEGADALLLRTTELVRTGRAGKSWKEWLAAKTPLHSYQKYLKYRGLLRDDDGGEAITNVLEFKELEQDVRLHGSRCQVCGTVQYPLAHVCINCRTPEKLETVPLSRRGTVFTYTVDHLIANVEHPLPMAVVDLDGGGRLYLQVTDFVDGEVEVGTPVVLTYRRLHEGGHNHNYYWKARPVR